MKTVIMKLLLDLIHFVALFEHSNYRRIRNVSSICNFNTERFQVQEINEFCLIINILINYGKLIQVTQTEYANSVVKCSITYV